MNHKVLLYSGPMVAYRGRWVCTCGVFLPRVPFGIPLEKAFASHEEEAERASQASR